jgi:cell division protein FtsA
VAEAVKLKHARLGDESDKALRVVVDDVAHNFSGAEVNMIVEARVEELLEYVEKELQRIHRARKLPGGVVMVGGTALLPGLAEFTKEKLQLPARIGKVRNLAGLVDTVNTAPFATAAGLMLLDILLTPYVDERAVTHGVIRGNIGSSISRLLGRLKP